MIPKKSQNEPTKIKQKSEGKGQKPYNKTYELYFVHIYILRVIYLFFLCFLCAIPAYDNMVLYCSLHAFISKKMKWP